MSSYVAAGVTSHRPTPDAFFTVCVVLQVVAYDPVALTRLLFQTSTIHDDDVAAGVADQALILEPGGLNCHTAASVAELLSNVFLTPRAAPYGQGGRHT
jgi:hypothetical protein